MASLTGVPLIPFHLARLAHGQRNVVDSWEEDVLQQQGRERRQVVLPGVDAATAYAMVKTAAGVLSPTELIDRDENGAVKRVAVPMVESEMMRSVDVTTARSAEEVQKNTDLARVSRGYVVFIHEKWKKLPLIVSYFDMLEKGEAPDTPLLEWLTVTGVVDTQSAKATIEQFSKPLRAGRTVVALAQEDIDRLKMAVTTREQLEAEEEAERRRIAVIPGSS